MRLVALLVCLLLAPVAASQTFAASDLVIDDDLDDETIHVELLEQPGNGRFPQADIVRAWITRETPTDFVVGVQVASWPGLQGTPAANDRRISVSFDFAGHDFLAAYNGDCPGMILQDLSELDSTCIEVVVDSGEGFVEGIVPKAWLEEQTNHLIGPGDEVGGFAAQVSDTSTLPLIGSDRITDETSAAGSSPYRFREAPGRGDSLEIFSEDPLRFSNGGSGSFVYNVSMRNLKDEPRLVVFETSGEPNGWSVHHPGVMQLGATSTNSTPIVLVVQAAHGHGTFDEFTLRMTDHDDDSKFAEVKLGLDFPPVPNPAGHHNRLWFHAKDAAIGISRPVTVWMNAAIDDPDPAATDAPYPGFMQHPANDPGRIQWTWPPRLKPGLQMGLDFDLNRSLVFEGAFESSTLLQAATAKGALFYCDPSGAGNAGGPCSRGNVLLAEFEESLGDLPGGVFDVMAEVPVLEAADLLPYQAGGGLAFEVEIAGTSAVGDSNVVWHVADSSLNLPLFEYREDVDLAAFSNGLTWSGGSETIVANPGLTRVAQAELTSGLSEGADVSIEIVGAPDGWVRANPDTISLAPGDSRLIQLVITVPADASVDMDQALVILAREVDGSAAAVTQLFLDVRDDVVLSDESDLVDAGGKESSPGPGVLLLAPLFAGALIVERRSQSRPDAE